MAAIRTTPAYCEVDDLTFGDLQVPRDVSLDDWIKITADEMDADLGQIYCLPFAFDNTKAEDRADALLLKKINAFLTMGRVILTIAGATDGTSLHAYGKSLLGDAKGALGKITNGSITLESAQLISDVDAQYNGPIVNNRDAGSFVDAFYNSHGTAHDSYTTWNAGF